MAETPSPETITVNLGARAYPIHVGADLLADTGRLLTPLMNRPRTVIVSDDNVAAAHGATVRESLSAAGVNVDEIALPPGEATKSFASLETLISRLLQFGVERSDLIVALGGGVIGDITGFAAGILRRGCRFAQIPTSLLAQVDSAVGGKTAVNTPEGKNLVGVFHQPAIVIADVTALETLPARERRAGYAEVVKYGAIDDSDFFAWLEENGRHVINGATAAQIRAVSTSVKSKARIVAADERENGVRALLNLGHTFGHALEAAFGFSDKLLHGEAVAAGMGLAFDYSVYEGLCPPDDADRMKRHLRDIGLPAGLADIDGAAAFSENQLMDLMMQDKKVEGGALTLILTRGIGRAEIKKDVDAARVCAFLADHRTGAS